MSKIFMISDAAKEVEVENHVLRYWEEELQLAIKRNKSGQRYYTEEDLQVLKQVKNMKDRGLQLKAIKLLLKNGKLERDSMKILPVEQAKTEESKSKMPLVKTEETKPEESREEKIYKLQWALQEMMKNAVRESNAELCKEIKDSIVKELDYQFRMQDEKAEEREERREKRDELYYKKMDELLRIKSNNKKEGRERKRRFF